MATLSALWFGPSGKGGAREFFEDEAGGLSMTRLLNFLAFWPASWVLIKLPSVEMATVYLGVFGGVYVLGKGVDAWRNKPASPPTQIASTLVNQPGGSTNVGTST